MPSAGWHHGPPVQLALALDGHDGAALDVALDRVRATFGSAAVTRAVLLGRDQGPAAPLPHDESDPDLQPPARVPPPKGGTGLTGAGHGPGRPPAR